LAELLVIAEDGDAVADRLAAGAESSGWSVEHLTYAGAAGRLSIGRVDGAVRVAPAAAIFLRLPRAPSPWHDGETQFHASERCSLVWAAAALTEAPVVNRPDRAGLSCRCTPSASVLRRRAGSESNTPETFASHAPDPVGPPDEWWVERQGDHVSAPWSRRGAAGGPFRAGRVRPGFQMAVATVVGRRTFVTTPTALDAAIRRRSVLACRRLGLTFAAAVWRWYPDERLAELVRVNPHPGMHDIGEHWPATAKALLSELAH
jgi:hypothetical protein